MNCRSCFTRLAALLTVAVPLAAHGQASVSEDFTGASTNNPWYFFNGACLTAGSASGAEPSGGGAGQMPGCVTIKGSYYKETLVGGYSGTFPDPVGNGALRFTNGYPGGYHQNGAIVSTTPFPTGQGISITFKTITYLGDKGRGGDGADGISFYLMDASQLNTATITGTAAGDGNGIGAWGGSLGYSCSNANPPYNGLVGAYLGLGIDEFGNFLNGTNWMPGYNGPNAATADNSALGYGYKPGRIGLRGAGNVAWSWLSSPTLNPQGYQYYPNTFTSAQQQAAVQATCKNGVEWDLSKNNKAVKETGQNIPVADYAPIPGAYVELPSSLQIANEAATTRGAATPILYQLKISQNGLLSFSYSINGGAYQQVIAGQDITTSNGPLPSDFLFGFAGSTGGSTNIHEILCFRADPATSASGSAGASQKPSTKLESGVQAYFAFYDPSGWTGHVTATGLGFDKPFGNVILSPPPTWDAACTLTGVPSGSTCLTTGQAGPVAAQSPASRAILSWNGSQGIPYEWSNLTSAQQSALTSGDTSGSPALSSQSCPTSPATAYAANDRLNYLRGDRRCEVNSAGAGLFRRRSDVLADIVDSSVAWVGPPIAPYAPVWSDRLYPTATHAENASSAQTYAQYVAAAGTRMNVVYVGSNDGLLHGFRSGSYDANGNFVATGNDGQEVLAYMPGAVVQTIHSTTNSVDYSNPQYGHNFFVDATPATGDVFYGGQWHSWLVGGLGPGGNAIFALDVSDPTTFAESNAANLVIGEWNPSTITCANATVAPSCGNNLGNTYGTPQIRRLHDGKWAVIFGNGLGSVSGDAGIFVMTIDPVTGAGSFYYLSTNTGSPSSPNGITFASPADLDGDHITDYVYAGDLQGNLWRFDLTDNSESSWAVSPGPLFKTASGQPITTGIAIASGAPSAGMQAQLMLLFGTGQKTPITMSSPATYASGTQSLYGVWDWNMSAWNALASVQYASLNASATGLSTSNNTLTPGNLQQQTVTVNNATLDREIATNATVCWAGQTSCATNNNKFGWYLNLPGAQEQIVYSPALVMQALTVNSVVPASSSVTSCAPPTETGFSYVINAMTGGAFRQVFLPPSVAANSVYATDPKYNDTTAIALQTNATGTPFVTTNAGGTRFLVYETNQLQAGSANIAGGTLGLNLPSNGTGRRLSWIERR